MIVVDTNTIAYLLTPGKETEDARAVLWKDPDWRVPVLWRSEFRNVLAIMMRQKGLALEDAMRLMEKAEKMLGNAEYRVPSAQVLALTKESGCSACDCEFVALARDLGAPLVTSDKAVLRAFPDIALAPEAFLDL
jgi:predicted nucleic acid-binding protein